MMAPDEILDAAMRSAAAECAFRDPDSEDGKAAHARLDELVSLTKADAGAAFRPDALVLLAAVRKADKAAFEAIRAQLKTAGCRVTELDRAIAGGGGADSADGADHRRRTQSDVLVKLAQGAELFREPEGKAFADLEINGHRETCPVRSTGFRQWLTRGFYVETQGAPNADALQSAIGVIEAQARYDSPERAVFIRVGGHDGRVYLDLGDEAWRAVEIDASGYRVVDRPPIRFRRTAGMLPLPIPEGSGSIETLRPFLNVRSDTDFVLAVSWLLAAFRACGPYPVLTVAGEQGSAKSTFIATLRALIDPNTAPLRALPREERDLFISASNAHVLAFDNVSGLSPWISDTFCRLATGAGYAVRALYTDGDEVLFEAARPILLNGIEDIVTRPDLADRAVFLTLDPIPEERRLPEQELRGAFEAARPAILGALLSAVSTGLAMLPSTKLDRLPRMADFAIWATACQTAFWPRGTFAAAYDDNRRSTVERVIDFDPLAAAVRSIMVNRTEWAGTYSELLTALDVATGSSPRQGAWPTSTQALAGRLRRAATFLRKLGVEIEFTRQGHAGTRTLRITSASPLIPEAENRAIELSAASAVSAFPSAQPSVATCPADPSDASIRPLSAGGKPRTALGPTRWSARL